MPWTPPEGGWGFGRGAVGKEEGESSLENMLMDSYLGVQQVVTCKGQTLKTKKCKWDMLAQCSHPRRALCRTSFEGDGWSLGSQLSWLQTTDLLLEDWAGPVLTITPCIIAILQACHRLEIARDSLWNVFPAPWLDACGRYWVPLTRIQSSQGCSWSEVSFVLMENRHGVVVAWSLVPG